MKIFMALSAPDERLLSSANLDPSDTIFTKVYLPWQFKKLVLLSKMFFIGPESDHWLCLSVTRWLIN